MKIVQAIFEDGVFRPTEAVDLPDRSRVEFEPRLVSSAASAEPGSAPMDDRLAQIYAILGERFDSGESDVAARHNEHQP